MKKQINPTIKAHLIRGAFYLLLLLAVCAIPFALAQRNATKRGVVAKFAAAPPASAAAQATRLSGVRSTAALQSKRVTQSNAGSQSKAGTQSKAASQLLASDRVPGPARFSSAAHGRNRVPNMGARLLRPLIPNAVYMIDDGTAEDGVGFGNGSQNFESLQFNQFDVVAGQTLISTVSVAWGTPLFPDPSNNGTPITIGIWSDPNGDGNPSDAVLLGQVSGTIQNEGTDTFVDYTLSPAVDVSAFTSFFVGDMTPMNNGPEHFFQGIDENNPLHRQSWIAAMSDGSAVDFTNPGNNDFLGLIDDFGIPGNWLIRADTGGGGGSPTPTATATPTGTPGGCVINGSIDTSDPTQLDRLFRSGIPQTCPASTSCAIFGDATPRHYDSYTFTNTTGATQCVTVDTNTACTGTNFVFIAAYLGSFDPNNLCTNWIGDSGFSPNPEQAFQFNVDDGQTFVVVVSEVTPDAGCPAYTVTVTPATICGGGGSPTPTATVTATPTGSPTCIPGGTPGPWTAGNSYPTTIVRYGFAQTATHFYVFGGVDNGSTTSAVNRMNIATGTWESRAPMPFSGEAPTCALMESTGIVYCADGFATNSFAAYDIASDTWTSLAADPFVTDHYGSASGAFNGKVYVVGGTSAFSNAVWVYDVAGNSWSLGNSAPTGPFELAGYQEVGQFLYLVGGYDTSFANLTTSLRLDMSTGTWDTGPTFTPQLADFGLAYDAGTNKLYSLGGDLPNDGNPFNSTNQVNELDVSAWPGGSWNPSPPNLPAPNRQAAQAGFFGNGDIWSVGGINGATFQFLNEVWHRNNGGGGCASPTPTASPSATVSATPTATPTGTPSCTPIVINGSIANGDPTQTDKLAQSGNPQTCPPSTTCAIFGDPNPFRYDSYMFTNTTGATQCVTIDTNTVCNGDHSIMTAAYLGSFDPNNVCNNWIGDAGIYPNPDQAFQVEVNSGQTLVVVVSEAHHAGCPNYTLTITGLCGGGGTPTPTATASPTCTPGGGSPGPWTQAAPVAVDHYGGFMDSDGTFGYEGGGYSFSVGDNINEFGKFDPVANTWTPLAPVPDLNNGEASAVYAPNVNKLFVFGGEGFNFATVVNTTRIYDIATNTWSTGAPMPDIRAFMASGYFNGKIYLVGGYNTGNVDPSFGQVWEYDPVTNTWDTSRTSMPATLGGAGSGVINGHIYVAGGRDINNTNLNTLYDYDIAADSWTQRANLPSGTNVPASAVIGGQLWAFGGGNPFGGAAAMPLAKNKGMRAPDTTNILQVYDPVSDSWTTGPSLNQVRSFPSGTDVGNTAVAVGGYDGVGTITSVEVNVTSGGGGCPSATPTATASPTATATPTASGTASATATPTATATTTATATATATATPTSTARPTPTPRAKPTPRPAPTPGPRPTQKPSPWPPPSPTP